MEEAASNESSVLGRKQLKRIVARFLALRDERVSRIRATLTHEQRGFFDLLPLLWHVNHPMMPGFVSSDTPAGVAAYRPNRDQLLLARRYVRGFKDERQIHLQRPIRGLYLMGSMGSMGQTAGSDLDFWLCHSGDLDQASRNTLRHKADRLEEHAANCGLQAHFFLMHDQSFRDGVVEQLSKESSGHTQHLLLLEEFYRTGLLIAGNPMLWWAVPPEQEENYASYSQRLIEKRFVQPDKWLDFGGLSQLPAEEFFGVAHWQLFKGIDAPYKSLLKLMLLEAYAAEYPRISWLCLETKRAVYSSDEIDVDQLDPYLLILQRITHYLSERNEGDRLQLARRAFYFKVGQTLTSSHPRADWRYRQMVKQCANWGWRNEEIAQLNTRPEWKLDRVAEERNALVSELSRSYRLLIEFAREQDAAASLNTRELALLGRKLYAALDKRPGKIDRVNPGISRDLSERTLWLRASDDVPTRWQLYRQPPDQLSSTPTKTSLSLVEILTWLHVNGICEHGTRIHYLPKPQGYGEPEQDKILKTLQKCLSRSPPADPSLEAYTEDIRGRSSLWFVNVAHNPLASLAGAGYQLISERVDALSFGAAHTCLVANVEHLYTTSWGEIRVERHLGGGNELLFCLCRYLELFSPHALPPEPISAYSFSSTRGSAIAARVARLVHSVAETFYRHRGKVRYIVRIADGFFQIYRQEDRYAWASIGELEDLAAYLANPCREFRVTRIDRQSMQESPLPTLMKHNEAGAVQVFYQVMKQGIQLYVFDCDGALFQRWVAGADEHHLMIHQRRFLDDLAGRRLLTSIDAQADAETRFCRIARQPSGDWQISAIDVPHSRLIDHTEMLLSVGPGGDLQHGFRLQLGRREFDSLTLGDELYPEVARHVKQLRRTGDSYPVYLTGIVGTEGDGRGQCSLIELLQLKQQVEQCLAEAMHQTSADSP